MLAFTKSKIMLELIKKSGIKLQEFQSRFEQIKETLNLLNRLNL